MVACVWHTIEGTLRPTKESILWKVTNLCPGSQYKLFGCLGQYKWTVVVWVF